jgi:hypothetical protein
MMARGSILRVGLLMARGSILRVGVPLAMGVLELTHPTWSDTSVSQGVAAAGSWWIPLHVLLIVGDGLLVRMLWTPTVVNQVVLGGFAAASTAFLAVDGLAVGLLSQSDPAAADALWNNPVVQALGNVTGAAWAAALLATAAALFPSDRRRVGLFGSALTWATFVASGLVPFAAAASRALALATGMLSVQASGVAGVPFALLVFAAILRQHVGPEAALGMLCIAIAQSVRRRSGPAVASPP